MTGIEGNYRATCEIVMQVLRDNKESLVAVLATLVCDPVLNWRLLKKNDSISEPADWVADSPSFITLHTDPDRQSSQYCTDADVS